MRLKQLSVQLGSQSGLNTQQGTADATPVSDYLSDYLGKDTPVLLRVLGQGRGVCVCRAIMMELACAGDACMHTLQRCLIQECPGLL